MRQDTGKMTLKLYLRTETQPIIIPSILSVPLNNHVCKYCLSEYYLHFILPFLQHSPQFDCTMSCVHLLLILLPTKNPT